MRRELFRDWVALQHRGQLVKETYLPYMHHLDFVADLVKDRVELGYEAGLGHDLLEKTSVTPNALRTALIGFGYTEAELITSRVEELTDVFTLGNYPEMPKKERKQREAERLAAISPAAQSIKYADLIYNIGWVKTHEPRSKARKYLLRKRSLLSLMNKGDQLLYALAIKKLSLSAAAFDEPGWF